MTTSPVATALAASCSPCKGRRFKILRHSSTSAPRSRPCCSFLLLALLRSRFLMALRTKHSSLCLVESSTHMPSPAYWLQRIVPLISKPAHASVTLAPATGPSVRAAKMAAKAALPKLLPRRRATSTAFHTQTAPGSARQESTPTVKKSGI